MHSRTARGRMAGSGCVRGRSWPARLQASAAVSPNPIVRPFSVRYAINTNGDIAMAANTLLTCPTGALETQTQVGCADVQTGGFGDDNYFDMRYVDVDGDASTFDSSSANLTVPAGATVLFAGLYWGAALDQGETLPRAVRPEPAAHRLARGRTRRRRPLPCCRARARAAYVPISASVFDTYTENLALLGWAASTSARATRASPT